MYENKPLSPFLNIELLDSTPETPASLSMSVRNFLFSGNKITAINGSVEGFEKKAYDGSLIYNHTFANQTDEEIAAGFSHLLDYNMKDFGSSWKFLLLIFKKMRFLLILSYLHTIHIFMN